MQRTDTPLSWPVVVHAGVGLVARFPGIVFVAGEEETSTVGELLRVCREASAGLAPGRVLARRFGGLLAQRAEEGPHFGTVAAVENGVAVFLSGDVWCLMAGDGPRLSGRDAAGWLDRVYERPAVPMTLALRPDWQAPTTRTTGLLDLREGVVPGSALTLEVDGRTRTASAAGVHDSVGQAATVLDAVPLTPPHAETDAAAPRGPEPASALADGGRVSSPTPVPPRPVGDDAGGDAETAPPAVHASLQSDQDVDEPREPLPEATGPIPPKVEAVDRVKGYLCSRDHLNDPRVLFCSSCGIRMSQRTGVLVEGARPPLGLLIFDTGATFVLDHDYVLGREPEIDERVQEGELRPLHLEDPHNQISRAHAVVGLRGWDVTIADIGSANGTYVAQPGQSTWSLLEPHEPVVLSKGAAVRVGTRTLTFETPHGEP